MLQIARSWATGPTSWPALGRKKSSSAHLSLEPADFYGDGSFDKALEELLDYGVVVEKLRWDPDPEPPGPFGPGEPGGLTAGHHSPEP